MRPFIIGILALAICSPLVQAQEQEEETNEAIYHVKTMISPVEHARADEVVTILNELFDIKFSIHKQANTIYARGEEEQIKEAKIFIHNLEKAAAEAERKRNGTRTVPLNTAGNTRSLDHFDIERSLLPLIVQLARTAGEFGSEHPKSKELSGRIDSMRKSLTDLADQFGSDIASIEKDLMPLIIEQAMAASELGSNHPEVRSMEKQIEVTRQVLRDSRGASHKGRGATRASIKYSAQHHELETEVSKLAAELRESGDKKIPDEEAEQIKTGLTKSVGNLFDVRQQAEEADWMQANEQLSKIRTRLDERKRNRDAIIQKRVESLLAEDEKE